MDGKVVPRCRHRIPRRTLIPESVLISQQAQRLRKGHPEWVWEGYGLGIKFRRVIGKRVDVKQSREECSTRREENLDQNPEELQHFKVGSGEGASKEDAKGATREGGRKPESKLWKSRKWVTGTCWGWGGRPPGGEKWMAGSGYGSHWRA